MDLVHPLSTCAETCNISLAVFINADRWKAFGFCLLMILLICGSSCNACKAFSSGSFLSLWTNVSSISLGEPVAHTFNWVRATLTGLSLTCFRTHLSEKGLSNVDLVVSLATYLYWMTHYLYYMKLGDSAQSVPQLLLSVLKILRRIVCLIKLGPQLSPLFWCHLQDSYSHLGLDVLALQGTVEKEVSLLIAPVACPFFPSFVPLFLGE